jgi:predicted nucleotidyltransferase
LKAVSDFLKALQRSDLRLKAAYLYGSYASGNAHPDSDIDVALISEDFTGEWLKDQERIVDALLSSDSRIEPARFRPQDFTDDNPLVWEIKSKGIKLL